MIRSIVDAHLDQLLPLVREYLPAGLVRFARVPAIDDALRMVHRPTSIAEAEIVEGRVTGSPLHPHTGRLSLLGRGAT